MTSHTHCTHALNIPTSSNDTRDYAAKTLGNGLTLLVISDPQAQRSAAAVDVNVGSSSDPDEFLGLAHFLEHMLFLGTDHYPDSDDYINYISDHGGSHNAFTAFDHTNYFFDIDPHYLKEGLKRFSRFFVAPLMLEKYVEREQNAVDSEFQSQLSEDGWRSMEALKQAVSPRHPYSRFSIGNHDTLGQDGIRAALIEFYQCHYSAERMSAVIIGRENCDTLLTWGEELFRDVPQRDTVDTNDSESLFAHQTLPIAIYNQSLKNEKNLSLYFQFPYDRDAELSKSLGYLSYILGYEGDGSLLNALKDLGYASQLYSGAGYKIGNETSFEIGMQLTDLGYHNINSVTSIVFAYLDLIKQDTNGSARYQEIAAVAKTEFTFKEKRPAMHEVCGLATRINRYPLEYAQSLNAHFSGYNQSQIYNYLEHMTPAHAVIQISSPDIVCEQTTPYFAVPYRIESLQKDDISRIAATDHNVVNAMHLPRANPFLADDYRVIESSKKTHHEILANGIELFYRHNDSFNVPRASVQISIQPAKALDITSKTKLSLLSQVLDEHLTTILYDASIAGVHTEVAAGEKSLALSLEGYRQKMPEVLQTVLAAIRPESIQQDTFDRVKDNYIQDLENTVTKMPYQQTFMHLNDIITDDASLPEERLNALHDIDKQSLQAFVTELRSSLAIRMLVFGNQSLEGTYNMAELIATALADADCQNTWQQNGATIIPKDTHTAFEVPHSDNAITYYIQGEHGHKARALVGLLAKLVEPQFFSQLRTEKQLGYIVFAYPRPSFMQSGIGFTIQSPVANTDELQNYIEEFLADFAASLDDISSSQFDDIQTILEGELRQEPENLVSAANIYWSDILTTNDTVSSRDSIADTIQSISRDEFISATRTLLSKGKRAIITAHSQQIREV